MIKTKFFFQRKLLYFKTIFYLSGPIRKEKLRLQRNKFRIINFDFVESNLFSERKFCF